MLYFDVSEYQQRLNKTKDQMVQKGLDALIVTDPANMNYISGYDGWSFYVHQGLIVFEDKDQPVWFGREQDSNGAIITVQNHNHGNTVPGTGKYFQNRHTWS